MFTGIVTDLGEVVFVSEGEKLKRLKISCSYEADQIALGASIACSGICLTVVAVTKEFACTIFEVDVGLETLTLTTAGAWRAGAKINLERALRIGDELGGHLVTGHIDGTAKIISRDDLNAHENAHETSPHDHQMTCFWFEAPTQELASYIAKKGSVTVDGVSLTVNEVENRRFSVLLIPHTLKMTTLGARQQGDRVNLEVDLMARYAARLHLAREHV